MNLISCHHAVEPFFLSPSKPPQGPLIAIPRCNRQNAPLVPPRVAAASADGAFSCDGGLQRCGVHGDLAARWRFPPHFNLRRSALAVVTLERGGLRGQDGKDKMNRLQVGLHDVLYRDTMPFHESG